MIICVEDEKNICELEVYTLQSVGLEAVGVQSGAELWAALELQIPELIVLDIMLPDEDGLSIIKKLRNQKQYQGIPVIMATAKGTEFDKVKGLDSGADDYLVKPFGMMEFVARIKAVLRRCSQQGTHTPSQMLNYAQIEINLAEHKVYVAHQEVELTYKEFELLKLFMQYPGIVFSRDKLLNDVWGYEFGGETRTVDVHMRTLRQKIGDDGTLLETVRGVGYRLAVQK